MARIIVCFVCGGDGRTNEQPCEECNATGTLEHDSPPRKDGLPWHPWARENATDLVRPSEPAGRKRATSSDPATPRTSSDPADAATRREVLTAIELEAENASLRRRLAELDKLGEKKPDD